MRSLFELISLLHYSIRSQGRNRLTRRINASSFDTEQAQFTTNNSNRNKCTLTFVLPLYCSRNELLQTDSLISESTPTSEVYLIRWSFL